ncbi:DUF2726 domain-containing protein [Cupriavidus sp. LEh25]|uniref:DUF2726 domain-containing protein n=1 Tax=Cupriavidus consociatus TaxID=2821357 RepID=UPI001AE59D53|nr:DUF2726 domain-containing protein [Cupriavidus sp. LEh25]
MLRPLYVIELDGASHGTATAQKRDMQKNDVVASAGNRRDVSKIALPVCTLMTK